MPGVESSPEKNLYIQILSSFLKDYREGQGFSLRRMAARFGIDEGTYSRIESGQRGLPLQRNAFDYLKELPGLSDDRRVFVRRLAMTAAAGWDMYEWIGWPPLFDNFDPAKSRVTFARGAEIRIDLTETSLTDKSSSLLLDNLQDSLETVVKTRVDIEKRGNQRRAKYYPST